MTPATIRSVAELRRQFYTLFSATMNTPVSVAENAYISSFSMASWLDSQQKLNYVCVYAHTAPDELVPERPLVLRVAVNKGAGTISPVRRRGCQGLNQNWNFELTLLPEEILDFLPWLVSLVKSYDNGFASLLPEPPYPLDFTTSNLLLFQNAQTRNASSSLSQQLLPEQEMLCLKAISLK
ncbi:MAG: hypothetical protein Kow00121_35190 [Elainellaceae cyanobacterium]